MTKPLGRDSIYRCRRFSAETIELCVRWYTSYRLSYRDLAAMMAEHEVIVAHTTIIALGPAVCAGIRAPMGSVCSTSW